MSRLFVLFLLTLIALPGIAQKQSENLLLKLMQQHPQQFDSILQNKERFKLQIIYTQIDRDKNNEPHLTSFCLDTGKYFYYCASMIKLLEVPLVMEKINTLSRSFPISIYDSLVVSGDPCGDLNETNYRKRSNFSTPAQLIKEMLLVSNNHAFNPLYDFLTQAYANQRAHELGYKTAVFTNRFANCDTFQNRISGTVLFYDRTLGKLKYLQRASVNPDQPVITTFNTLIGQGFFNGKTVDPPRNFAYNNFVSLGDLHRLVIHLTFPELQQPKMNLTAADYAFIRKYMGMYPRESVAPKYDTVGYPNNVFKYFVSATDSFCDAKNVRVFNKVGLAYGFVTDCSYFMDTLNKVEFFLSCTMYTNQIDVLNTGIYEYDQTAYPFFKNLCSVIYQHELARPRKHKPVFGDWDFTDTVF